jgi:hypothetical protein
MAYITLERSARVDAASSLLLLRAVHTVISIASFRRNYHHGQREPEKRLCVKPTSFQPCDRGITIRD